MSKRAKYVGPHPEVDVYDPHTGEKVDTVRHNGLLSKDAPAYVRDSLIVDGDKSEFSDWKEVADPAGSSSSSSSKED